MDAEAVRERATEDPALNDAARDDITAVETWDVGCCRCSSCACASAALRNGGTALNDPVIGARVCWNGPGARALHEPHATRNRALGSLCRLCSADDPRCRLSSGTSCARARSHNKPCTMLPHSRSRRIFAPPPKMAQI